MAEAEGDARGRLRRYAYAIPAAVWAGLLLGLAIAEDLGALEPMEIVANQDKAYHFLEYLVLAALTYFALSRTTDWWVQERFFATIVASTLYGIFLEIVQAFLPYRSPSALDVLANTLGAVVGAAITIRLMREEWRRKG